MHKSAKLKAYSWSGTDASGNALKGVSQAHSKALMQTELQRQGLTAIKIRSQIKLFPSYRKHKINAYHILDFYRQLTTLFSAGITLTSALDIIHQGNNNPYMQNVIKNIKKQLESGIPLSEALKLYPQLFSKLTCKLLYAGEQAGALDTMLKHVTYYQEKKEQLKKSIKQALFYPTIVIVTATAISVFLLVFIVPQFEILYQSLGAQLPSTTQLIITISKLTQTYFWPLPFIILLTLHLWKKFNHLANPATKKIDQLLLKLPLFGSLLKKTLLARTARVLAITINAGLPVPSALTCAAESAGNSIYQQGFIDIRKQISGGRSFHRALENTQLFPHRFIQLTAIGEQSGRLEDMFTHLANYFDAELKRDLDKLTKLIEPITMLILGLLIGSLIIALYLPIFHLGAAV